MGSRRSRETAYGDLVAGLLDVRHDPATERFDAELAAAEQDGRVDPATAKVLRWWQREALRSLVEHARVVVPPTLLALEDSENGATADAAESSQSWARAVGDDVVASELALGGSAGPPGHPQLPQPAPDAQIVLPAAEPSPVTPPTDLAEHRRRLLVAGLTRVTREP